MYLRFLFQDRLILGYCDGVSLGVLIPHVCVLLWVVFERNLRGFIINGIGFDVQIDFILPSVGTINGNAMNCGTLKEMIQSSHSNMSVLL